VKKTIIDLAKKFGYFFKNELIEKDYFEEEMEKIKLDKAEEQFFLKLYKKCFPYFEKTSRIGFI
jgi:hypothetical protein